MRSFTQKPKQSQKPASSSLVRPHKRASALNHSSHAMPNLQRRPGEQSVQQSGIKELNVGSTSTASSRFAHDFSRVPASPKASAQIQPKLMLNTPGDKYEQEADRVAGQVMRMPEGGSQVPLSGVVHTGERSAASTPILQRAETLDTMSASRRDALKEEGSRCPSWRSDPQSISKRAAEFYARNHLTPPSQATVERIECEPPIWNGNYGCYVHFSDGLVLRVIVRETDIVVGTNPIAIEYPPPATPLCFYEYSCPKGQLVLVVKKCQSAKPSQPSGPPAVAQRRAASGAASPTVAPSIVHDVLNSPGRPLDAATRAFMEPRFGHDFSRVRVHSGSMAEQSARDLNAHAYTVGHNIVFGAGRFAPGTQEGRRLIAHELTHVVQQSGMDTAHVGQNDHQRGQFILPVLPNLQPSLLQSGMALQRKPVKRPDIKPVPALAPLEVVAQEAAKLVLKNYAADKIPAGPVLTAVHDTRTGKIYIGLNSGIPPKVADVVAQAIAAQKERIEKGEVIVVRTDPLAQGGHSETNAVNEAVRAREALLKRKVTEKDLRTFELHNVWLKGADRKFTAAPRCEHCARIVRGVSVTPAVFFAEGGVSGTIKKPPTGGYRAPRIGPGGPTGTISGTIDPNKPRTSPPPAAPTGLATGAGEPTPVTARRGSSISPTSVAPAAHAAADLLTVVFAQYIFPDAEENYKKRIQELQNKVQPEIEARVNEFLKMEAPRIAELGRRSSNLFVTVKLTLWTQSSDVQGAPAIPVNLIVDEVKLSARNINESELSHSLGDSARCAEIGHCKSYQTYSFPVSSSIRHEAERRLRGVGASELKHFNELADDLKASSSKVRMAGLLNIYKLGRDIGPLRGPAAQQAILMLRDPEANIRGIAALVLRSLGATEAIPSIRQALAETNNQNIKDMIQKSLENLDRLNRLQK